MSKLLFKIYWICSNLLNFAPTFSDLIMIFMFSEVMHHMFRKVIPSPAKSEFIVCPVTENDLLRSLLTRKILLFITGEMKKLQESNLDQNKREVTVLYM